MDASGTDLRDRHLAAALAWARAQLRILDGSTGVEELEQLAVAEALLGEVDHLDSLRARLGLGWADSRILWIALVLDERGGFLDRATITRLASAGIAPDLTSRGALRRFALLERCDGGPGDLHEHRWLWTVTSRIAELARGTETLDLSLSEIARESQPKRLDDLALDRETVMRTRDAVRLQAAVTIVSGCPGSGRRSMLAALAHEAGARVLEINCGRLAKDPVELSLQLARLARECRLLDRVPLLVGLDNLDTAALELVGTALVASLDSNILATTAAPRSRLRWGRTIQTIELPKLTSKQHVALWRTALRHGSEQDAEFLATQYPLAPALVVEATSAIHARLASTTTQIDEALVLEAIRGVLDDRLGQFGERIAVTQDWNDLVLSADQLRSVRELIARIRQRRTVLEDWGFANKVGRGVGVTALFSGPPGTGKTMIAGLIARELQLEIYRVDLARLVSKWIGETEKQLAALFDAAEAGHAILLFDEADSLFGKRTEVRTSNDRYANLETNYLLQRLESFTGVCLLTSNHVGNIDPAFMRRLSLHLRFELPDEAERSRLWSAMIPSTAPIAPDLDFGGLGARFVMSGGYIRNAVLRAAFLAADEGVSITQGHLERAGRAEYEGMGKL